jgi:hypothetical protein
MNSLFDKHIRIFYVGDVLLVVLVDWAVLDSYVLDSSVMMSF